MKKLAISTLHQSYFKEYGKIRFDDFPFDAKAVQQAIATTLEPRLKIQPPFLAGRDLWRDSPILQKLLLKKMAILAIDLLDKQGLRLICDQFIPADFTSKAPLETLFGFHPLLCILSIGDAITFYHPSMPFPQGETYFALFGTETTCYIKKETDPANHLLKKADYAFGDPLKSNTHPLIYIH